MLTFPGGGGWGVNPKLTNVNFLGFFLMKASLNENKFNED